MEEYYKYTENFVNIDFNQSKLLEILKNSIDSNI